jgi:hypothetical protein
MNPTLPEPGAAPQTLGHASLHPLAALLHGRLGPEQLARVAARQALVSLKQSFMQAMNTLEGDDAAWLRRTVRQANDSVELWRLRPTVFALMPECDARSALHRHELNRQLDSIFPESAALDSLPPPGGLAAIPLQLRPR